ncbi:hypothetical protein BD410DRAFT_835121 [Rickenella mellea]|uniref:Uncharacterized protein n=1 Tax=Rickenella mellea TaxID=50990 RepID=A0A4Y7QLQ2_9AGAM|nr:hypothetical protein BD410DRAFT_835121 [Rickenella mellea]
MALHALWYKSPAFSFVKISYFPPSNASRLTVPLPANFNTILYVAEVMSDNRFIPNLTWIDPMGQPHFKDESGQWILFGPRVPIGAIPMPGPTTAQMPFQPAHEGLQTHPAPFVFPPTAWPSDPRPNVSAGLTADAASSQIPIDPALVPLPCNDATDAAHLCGHSPVTKVAGSRHTSTEPIVVMNARLLQLL